MKVIFLRSNPIDPYPRCEKVMQSLARQGILVRAIGWDREGFALTRNPPSQVEWISIPCSYGKGLTNIYTHVLWQIALVKKLLRERNSYTHIHAFDLDTVFPALIMKILFRKYVVYDISDYHFDCLAIPGIKQILFILNACAIYGCDRVLVPTESRKKRMGRFLINKIHVIYNTPPDTRGSLVVKHENFFRLAFIGVFSDGRFLSEIVGIIRRHRSWHLDIGGYGKLYKILQGACTDISSIRFLGQVSYEKTLQLYANSDVLFALNDPAFAQYRDSAPNKLYESMMLSKPILVARGTGVDALVSEIGCGMVCDYDNVLDVEKALVYLEKNPQVRSEMGKRGREAYEREYSWRLMEKRLFSIYTSF